jgi:hypothetical protein
MAGKFTCVRTLLNQLMTLASPGSYGKFCRLMLREARLYSDIDQYVFDVRARDMPDSWNHEEQRLTSKQFSPICVSALVCERTEYSRCWLGGIHARPDADRLGRRRRQRGQQSANGPSHFWPSCLLRPHKSKREQPMNGHKRHGVRAPLATIWHLVWRLDRIGELTGGAWTLERR